MALLQWLILVACSIEAINGSELNVEINVDGSSSTKEPALESGHKTNDFEKLSPLSWAAPRIYHYPNFLTDKECDYLIDFAKTHPDFNKKGSHGRLTSLYVDWDAIYTDPVIQSIEKRMGIVTGIPPHQHEEPINVHRIKANYPLDDSVVYLGDDRSRCKGGPKECARNISGIHHDKVQKEHSAATILVYLDDVEKGGGTVWPCRAEPPLNSKIANGKLLHGTLSEACQRSFDNGARWFDGKETTVVGQMRKMKTPSKSDNDLQDILWTAHLACLEETNPLTSDTPSPADKISNHHPPSSSSSATPPLFPEWPSPPVLTRAIKGHAIVFFHNHPNGKADPFAWHGGCFPVSNDKWTMQKFKEMPMSFR